MKDLSEKEFSDLMFKKLESLGYEQTLQYPTTESVFPCIELHNPLKSILKTHNAFPILSMFQFSVTCWNAKQRSCMDMAKEIDNKLQEYNLTRTNTSPLIFDNTSKKYGLTVTYEVRYNGITDSFNFIK